MRVLWVVVDALGNDKVTPDLMPNLSVLGAAGWAGTAQGVMPSITYPNHATFVTGVGPEVHGIHGNEVLVEGTWVAAQKVGPAAPTVFELLAAAGRSSVAVFGDQNLIGVCGAGAATGHWPPEGALVEGVELGPTGYAADTATVRAAGEADIASFDFAMVHLDENDGVCHVEGPDSAAARARATASDAALGEILDLYSAVWDETVVFLLSDHDQEPVDTTSPESPAVDISERLAEAFSGMDPIPNWTADGTSVLVMPGSAQPDLRRGTENGNSGPRVEVAAGGVAGVLQSLVEVEDVCELRSGALCASGAQGVVFGVAWGQKGDHGSLRCRPQVAAVGGGHPQAQALASRLAGRVPESSEWLGFTLDLLGVERPFLEAVSLP